MKYGLDVSAMKLPPWWPKSGPAVIPVKRGSNYDWDVCKSKLPKPFYTELVANLRKYNPRGVEPPGFNNGNMPKGAKIITLADQIKGGE